MIIHQSHDFCYYRSMPRHLLFDADGTLYDFKASEEYALSRLFSSLSIPYIPDYIDIYHHENDICWHMFERGEMTIDELKSARFRMFFERMKLPYDAIKAGEDYTVFLGDAGFMLPGATEFIERITKDYDASIITNGIAYTQHKRFQMTDTEKYFKNVFISEELGYQKPDKRFFDIVLSHLNLSPSDCLVIGDGAKSDIEGARNAGIESIFINFYGKTCPEADHSVTSYEELEKLIRELC